MRPIRTQNLATSTTAVSTPLAFASGTRSVRLATTQDCYVLIHPTATATASNGMLLRSTGDAEHFTAAAGDNVSAIQVSAAGILSVSEMSC